jgi:apolipoprotein N-acyltransferase
VALLIWPESALETWVPDGAERLPVALLPGTHPPVILGAMSFRRESGRTKTFNSAFLVDRNGDVRGRYHKQVLLAFGEYIPFAWLLSGLPGMPPIGDGFTPGRMNLTFNLAGARIAPLICYEDLMPWLTRRFINDSRANLLVNLTNDAWYGRSAAPWQHARLAQWRTIETRRAMIRSTNTGVTTIIDPTGEIRDSLPIFAEGVLEGNVPLVEIETFYAWAGDWFAFLVTGMTLLAIARSVVSGRQR